MSTKQELLADLMSRAGRAGEKTARKRRVKSGRTPDQRREQASKAGKLGHALRRSHEFTSEEARIAGATGGRKISQNREHMSEIGRRGGLKAGAKARARAEARRLLSETRKEGGRGR